jgi:hypothetical protein
VPDRSNAGTEEKERSLVLSEKPHVSEGDKAESHMKHCYIVLRFLVPPDENAFACFTSQANRGCRQESSGRQGVGVQST